MAGILHRVRTPSVLQLEAAECGAACLAMVLGYFGRFVPLDELRVLCGVSRDGAKASSLLKAARSFGLKAKGMKAEPEHLSGLQGPMIAFVNFNHFLVIDRVARNRVYLNDPASGRRVETLAEFADSFTGVVLVFEKDEGFAPGDTRPPLVPSLLLRMRGLGWALFFAFLVSLVLVVPGILVPLFSQIFVDYVLVRSLDDWLVPLLIGMMITAASRFLLIRLQGMTLLRLSEAMILRSGRDLVQHMMRLPIAFFEQRFSGELADRIRLNEDLVDLLTVQVTGAVLSAITAAFFLGAMLVYNVELAIAVGALGGINVLILMASTRLISERFRKISIETGKVMGARVAGLKDMETFKASGAEDLLYTRWNGLLASMTNATQAADRIASWFAPLPALVAGRPASWS